MKRTRAGGSSPIQVARDEQSPEPERPLQFSEPLSWQAGRAIATAELLRRLQTLATELKEADQEAISKESLSKPAQELVHPNILKHKDKGVKSWAAHCLVDIFKLAAPDAPFSGPQLKDIFNLVITQSIASLSDSSDAYHSQHYHVLEVLVSTKAIVLVTDIPSSSFLIALLFNKCFEILALPSESISKNVEYQLTGLLQCLIDECEALPMDAVECLFAQFMRALPKSTADICVKGSKATPKSEATLRQSKLQTKELPPAYSVAQSICNTCEDRVSRYVSAYFSSTILDASNFGSATSKQKSKLRKLDPSDQEEDDDEAAGPTKDDLAQLEKAHLLLRELWRACPGILHTVIPQIETELSADNVDLRRLATEAFGDMTSGIGADASYPQPNLDPSTYPPQPTSSGSMDLGSSDVWRAPKASMSFAHTHISAYQEFLGRRNDKSAEVRAAWTDRIGRILSTAGGGLGLGMSAQTDIITNLSQMLVDGDEKVRRAAVRALGYLSVQDFISKIGSTERSSTSGILMERLSERFREINQVVRSEAGHLLGKLWGVTAHEIATGSIQVTDLFSSIPSNILNAAYLNKLDINALIDQVLFESLIPLGYPATKRRDKSHSQVNGESKELSDQDADKIRVERLLLLYSGLNDRAKGALKSIMRRPAQWSKLMKSYLKLCEDYNGGVMDKNDKETKAQLAKIVDYVSNTLPDPAQAAEDMWRFAKQHDRRSYALIRFCMNDDSDYRKIHKSIRELTKRVDGLPSNGSTVSDTILALLYRVSNLFYNKSHLQAIMEISAKKGDSLADAAHELLRDVSNQAPGIFRAHGQELCHLVETSAPSVKQSNDHGAVDALKACAVFARRYPDQVPKSKSFNQDIMSYIQHGTPTAAKYATRIILLSSDKKEMHAKALLKHCVDTFEFGSGNYVSKLAGLSQMVLLNGQQMDEETEIDPVTDIAIQQVILRSPSDQHAHAPDTPAAQLEREAKCWAIKVLVNRLRAYPEAKSVTEIAPPVYKLLNRLLLTDPLASSTPHARAIDSHLRLQAAQLHLKLASHQDFDRLLSPAAFNTLVLVAQDPASSTRHNFINRVRKYLGQDRLASRFYSIVFLLAFEPNKSLKAECAVWLRARHAALQRTPARRETLELCFPRFLSVLAHHIDFSGATEDMEDLVTYIVFYLNGVATSENISLIYHVAQRVKTVCDGVSTPTTKTHTKKGAEVAVAVDNVQDEDISSRLFYLSDLSVAIISTFASTHNWHIQAYSGKVRMHDKIFALMPSHKEAQRIADKVWLEEEKRDMVEMLVKSQLRRSKTGGKKRKSDEDLEGRPGKRREASAQPTTNGSGASRPKARPTQSARRPAQKTKTPRKSRARSAEADDEDENNDSDASANKDLAPEADDRRVSSRGKGRKSYAEPKEADDDAEMWDWQDDVKTKTGGRASTGSEKENRVVV